MRSADDLLTALYAVYPDAAVLMQPDTGHMVIEGAEVLSQHEIPGVSLRSEPTADGIAVELTVERGVRLAHPLHACIGMLVPQGTQHLRWRLRLESEAAAHLVTHCLFPNAERIEHRMEAVIEVGEGAELRYTEGHYHGTRSGADVHAQVHARVEPRAHYFTDFSLTTGRVGRLWLAYRVEAQERAIAEIQARVFGHATDTIRVEDEIALAGREARGLIKTRIAVEDEARAEVIGITRGQAAGARGHMDCLELVRDRATARAEPIVDVSHPLAKVTHEAAVGTVDQQQLETLMARGLTPEQAVDVIVTGILQ